ncbi:hypothetical protein EDD86DRAFT_105242 [Gorgonomyces haynaldii]|nr:hypothetical protein EDD86DRAFT_105242 [Gorgonomyces haynaldii]
MLSDTVKNASAKLYDYLQDLTVGDLFAHKKEHCFHPLVTADQHMSISDYLKLIAKENVQACPVLNEQRQIMGMVSVFDILERAVLPNIFDPETFSGNLFDYVNQLTPEAFLSLPVSQFVSATKESAYPYMFSTRDTLADLLQVLTTNGYHRVLILDEQVLINNAIGGPLPPDAAVAILTQTDVIRYLLDSLQGGTAIPQSLLEPLFDVQLKDLDHLSKKVTEKGYNKVISITPSYSALNGFRIMHFHNVTAVPVVEDDEIVATLSGSDLRGLTFDNWESLTKPVFEFLEREKRQPNQVKADQIRSLSSDATAEHAMKVMYANQIHHLWLTNGEHLDGVVTFTDLLDLLTLQKNQ